MTPQETIQWAKDQDATGKRDAMGHPFGSWLIARYNPDGTAMRDERGDQVFETHTDFESRHFHIPDNPAVGHNLSLF